jgi:hypothetical protein
LLHGSVRDHWHNQAQNERDKGTHKLVTPYTSNRLMRPGMPKRFQAHRWQANRTLTRAMQYPKPMY